MLAVLDHIESLERPNKDMNGWAQKARIVVRSVEDMIDSFSFKTAKTSRAKKLKRSALYFNEMFLGYQLSPKVKRLLLSINNLSERSKVLNIGNDGGGGANEDAVIAKTTVARSTLHSVFSKFSFALILHPFKVQMFPAALLAVDTVGMVILKELKSHINNLRRVHNQILNVRKDQGGSEELEVTISREKTNTIISSFLKQIDSVLRKKILFSRRATSEVEQVRQDINCLSNLLKDMEAVRELDEREKVWMEWVREICLRPADAFLESFESEREQQTKSWAAKLQAPAFYNGDLVLRKKMIEIRSRIQYAYGRRWIYGMGESDKKREGLTPSTGFELESISQELKLMHALSKDAQGMEVQGGRGKAWLEQIEGLALEVDNFSKLIMQEKMKGRSPLSLYNKLRSIAKKIEEMSRKFYVMSERKITYDIGKFEGKRGQYSQIQDLQGTTASISGTTAEDNDNNLEEGQPGSSQLHTKTTTCEIEETENSSKVQDLPGTPASMDTVSIKNEDTPKITAEPSQMNDLNATELPTSDTVGRSYAKEQVESIKRELELIKAFLEDVEAIKEPDARLNCWEEEMREIAHEAEAIIGIYENTRVEKKSICTRLASLINRDADSKVVREISIINEKIREFTHTRIAYGIEHVEESKLGTRRRYKRSPPSQSSEESVVIGFDDQVNEIKERLLEDDEPNRCVISIVGIEGFGINAAIHYIS
ncbi:uncharacterized protein LOC126701703 [Quercus robur]|uniref:uncharacterized protein LOC126701703 n=1 Tax=Quercus robur TaxID=38942 RepID=UPI002162D02C|nr:uncharacterized protein LOC126701703 [Quercus robur]